jgi:predicted glycoside hydrolase/deacetylase ChbG (UPF0249 family)
MVKRYLIVNADDFGQSNGVNHGIIAAHEQGIVTSASLMVRWPAAVEAATYGRTHRDFSIGLHLDLGEWIYRDGAWVALYQVVDMDDPVMVANAVADQLAEFCQLVGQAPTHIDSHQHVHRSEPVRSIVAKLAHQLGVPLRHFSATVRYCGNFYGQMAAGEALPAAISVEGLCKILATLPPGISELGCHPGVADDVDSMYRAERSAEVRTLCDPRIRDALNTENVQLCSFHTLSYVRRG